MITILSRPTAFTGKQRSITRVKASTRLADMYFFAAVAHAMKVHRIARKHGCTVLAMLLIFWGRQCAAAITDPCWGPNTAQSINFGTVIVRNAAPLGGIIGEYVATPAARGGSSGTSPYYCYVKGADVSLFTTPYDASQKIYRTNIDGIGIAIATSGDQGWPAITAVAPFGIKLYTPALNGNYFRDQNYRVRLIKIADKVSSGNLSTGLASTFLAGNGVVMYRLNITGGTIVATNPTCDLIASDANKTINLDPFQLKNIPASNSFGERSFSIAANCTDAKTATFTFTGTPNTLGGDTYRFANTGTAKGLAMHLKTTADGQTIRADGTGGLNKRTIDVSNGSAVLNLAAAYWREPAESLATGSFKSIVTVTVGYD